MKKKMLLGFFLVLWASPHVYCRPQRADFRPHQDPVGAIKRGNFQPVIEEDEEGSMRVKNKYKTPEIKEALYQLLINPPKGFGEKGEDFSEVYLLRIMGDIKETRAIPYLKKCLGDKGVAMSLGRMGEEGFNTLRAQLKNKEKKMPASYVIALAEMARKGDVGYINEAVKRKEIRGWLLKALNNSDEDGRKYAVRGIGEFAVQGDTEAVALINKLATTDKTVGRSKDYPIRNEATKVLHKLNQKNNK